MGSWCRPVPGEQEQGGPAWVGRGSAGQSSPAEVRLSLDQMMMAWHARACLAGTWPDGGKNRRRAELVERAQVRVRARLRRRVPQAGRERGPPLFHLVIPIFAS